MDFQASVLQVRAPLNVRVYRADLALGLTLVGQHRVVVLGYLGEPFLRLTPDGAFVNAASPTAAGTKLTPPHARSSRPLWQLRSHRPAVVWHDARVRGVPSGELVGKFCWDLESLAAAPRVREETLRKLAGDRALKPHERRYQRPDGRVLTLETHETLLYRIPSY